VSNDCEMRGIIIISISRSRAPLALVDEMFISYTSNFIDPCFPRHYLLSLYCLTQIPFFCVQVTCPLLTYPLRNLVLKVLRCDITQKHIFQVINISTEGFIAWVLVLSASFLAMMFRNHVSAVCGFIGSFVTTINSIILPIIFYHSLCPGKIPLGIRMFNYFLLGLSVVVILYGVSSSLCDVSHYETGTESYMHDYCSHFSEN